MYNIGVLGSTRGTDLQAVIDALHTKELNVEISIVISNKGDAYILERARKHNIISLFIESKDKEREEFDKEVSKELEKYNMDLILLIGYMRILSKWFVKKYKNKIINIHPSLLPDFAGGMDMDVYAQVLKSGVKETGCTLHFVDETVDGGPIIMQKKINVSENDDVNSLKEKVQKAEQVIIVKALRLFEKGKIKIENNKVTILK